MIMCTLFNLAMVTRLTDYILTEDVHGEKAPRKFKIGGHIGQLPKHVHVLRGELLSSIPGREIVPRSDKKPAHNFRSNKDPTVTLYGGEDNKYVSPLNGKDLELLEAIERPGDRFAEFSKTNKLEWGGRLDKGDQVNVKIQLPNNKFNKEKKEEDEKKKVQGQVGCLEVTDFSHCTCEVAAKEDVDKLYIASLWYMKVDPQNIEIHLAVTWNDEYHITVSR